MNARVDYLARQRWFAGGNDIRIASIERLPWSRDPTDGFGVRFEIVTVTVDGQQWRYSVPASYRREPFVGLDNALMDHDGEFFIYDAIHDAHARTALLSGFFGSGVRGLEFHGDLPVDADAPTVELIADQSNSSIVVANSVILKMFRRIGRGRNPDIELSTALTDGGCAHVAPIRGWITLQDSHNDSGAADLALASDFIRSATTGWESARASFRDLLADVGASVEADQAGGNFAADAQRLGRAIRDIHSRLATGFGTRTWGSVELSALADRLDRRCDLVAATTPAVAPFVAAAKAAFDTLRQATGQIPVQRIHGDLHLGQTLRTIPGWIVVDFEGEPARRLSERAGFDSPLRDIAGMIRSFDYAAHSVLLQTGAVAADLASDWIGHNQRAFLAGYGRAAAPELLRAYEIDKALYEAAYESAHRPGWVAIPLNALARLLG